MSLSPCSGSWNLSTLKTFLHWAALTLVLLALLYYTILYYRCNICKAADPPTVCTQGYPTAACPAIQLSAVAAGICLQAAFIVCGDLEYSAPTVSLSSPLRLLGLTTEGHDHSAVGLASPLKRLQLSHPFDCAASDLQSVSAPATEAKLLLINPSANIKVNVLAKTSVGCPRLLPPSACHGWMADIGLDHCSATP